MWDIRKIKTFSIGAIKMMPGNKYWKTIYAVGTKTPKQLREIVETELEFLNRSVQDFKCTDIVKTEPSPDGSITFYIIYNDHAYTKTH